MRFAPLACQIDRPHVSGPLWRGGRVAEGSRLKKVLPLGNVGSNPTPYTKRPLRQCRGAGVLLGSLSMSEKRHHRIYFTVSGRKGVT